MISSSNALRRSLSALMFGTALLLGGCGGDEQIQQQAEKAGVGKQTAEELSTMKLTQDELASIATAKKAGIDDVTLLAMVKSEHNNNLTFTLGDMLAVLVRQGFSPTTLTELVKLGAIPRLADDMRALKDARVSDVAIIEYARLAMKENKKTLSGNEYGALKNAGLSDQGLLTFIRKNGNAQQFQTVQLQLSLGKSEAEALKEAGL